MTYQAPQAGVVATSPPVVVNLNAGASIPYPVQAPQGLSWAVVANSSPFTIVVTQGQILGQVAAFTSDLFPVDSGQPIGVTAIAGAGIIAPGTDSSVYATWYQVQPGGQYPAALGSGATPTYISTSLQPQLATSTVAVQTFGPYNVSGYAGVRMSMVCEPLFSNCLVDMRWYDSQAVALAPGLYDYAGIFDYTVQTGDSSNFVIPNMADWLVVKLQSADAGTTKPHWSLAARQQGFDIFGQGLGTGNQNVDAPAAAGAVTCALPPVNGPWYRLKSFGARANGTPVAGGLQILGLSDDGVNVKTEIAIYRTTAVANEVQVVWAGDITIANPTRLVYFNSALANVDVRMGATWEVVPPMFKFPRDT